MNNNMIEYASHINLAKDLIYFLSNRLAHNGEHTEGTFVVKSGLAQMCKGGLIMDVVNVEQAKIAEEAGVQTIRLLYYLQSFSFWYLLDYISI